ncbi:hypothetical protein FA15DRAFT_674517 [Coprinopsis marcescibilis]|uniref:Vacuolar sorting protein 39/Transforming growth factor beta receptor-associated domain-containing protein n=1 Tax=Coprinopsis marcescibilis TaxID=230819 RepID=A0A5C3KGP0_COPMA|nr:hypothetical protein FA15DRAFT_674517 [Coprinopsis marcescibilis]
MTSTSQLLVLGSNSVHSLVPSSLIAQVETLLESHKLEDAFNLADAKRKKLEESLEVDEDQADELRYVYQRLGFQYLSETLFEDAGNNLFNGQLDPRVLVSYFPDLRGGLFSDKDNVDLFAGIAEKMPREISVDDIIIFNLVSNYSPHLSPNTHSAPPTAELRNILQERALQMLETFLRKERRRRIALDLDKDEFDQDLSNVLSNKGKERERPKSVRAVIDTVLAKIYAQLEKTVELYDLLLAPNSIVLSEVEGVFRETGQYNALCMLYQRGGSVYDERLLEVWSQIIDGVWTDPDISEPLLDMLSLLTKKRDKALTQKWGIWLLNRDQEAGIRLLTTLRDIDAPSGKRRERERTATGEDLALLEQIQLASPSAAKQFLEHLVLQRRSTSKELHSRLALSSINEVLALLEQDEAVSKLWRAKVSSYASSSSRPSNSTTSTIIPSATPSFLSYFESTTPESPSKRARLCCVLFLSGSQLYDPELIKSRIIKERRDKILLLEIAVLEGKLGNHRSALTILARDLNDAASAEAYCSLQGDVIPPKVAIAIAEAARLHRWTEGLLLDSGTNGQSAAKAKAQSAVPLPIQKPEAKQKELLKVLLEVYMSDASSQGSERASQLLNAQAMNLDVLDVLELVPPSWPLPSLSSFLARSFRRVTHSKRESQIAKNISSGQNLETKEATWEPLRQAGAIIEDEEEEDGEKAYDEKHGPLNRS